MSSQIPEDLNYAPSHEWIRVEDGIGTIGISDHAQQELTDIVFVELPEVGRTLEANEACAVVESVKTASDIYAPAAGEIIEVNSGVEDEPALVNTSPFENGWFFKIRITEAGVPDSLLSAADYGKQIAD
jgi:glycine cleavage system H protein